MYMETALLLVQFSCKPVALFCCALFAGASTYISLVEHPTIMHGGTELIGSYLVFAKPRPAVFQTAFAATGCLAGISAAIAGAGFWWLLGGLLMGFAALFCVRVVLPQTRQLRDVDLNSGPGRAPGSIAKLARLHATQSIAALVSLFIFIVNF
jgi:hypothetical protein